VPTGKVKWFDAERGFGFLATDDGEEVFLHASALPPGTVTLKQGARLEFGVADGRKGKQALSVRLLEPSHSVAASHRKEPEDMVGIVEDLIKVLEGLSGQLRRGRYPERQSTGKVAAVLRKVADDLEG
jgi:CspA family cold shock protein